MLISPRGIAYLGRQNFHDLNDRRKGQSIKIDFFLRHAESYLGGGTYGDFGGIDITLLHLMTPAQAVYTPACLPRISFPDSGRKANLAGYGSYTRKSCQTDEYGPSKYHYCNTTCNTIDKPPRKVLCKHFFNNPASKNLGTFQDIVLDCNGKHTYCYGNKSPKPDSKGWCHVTKDASQLKTLQYANSWGFCSKDCMNDHEPDFGVLREVENVDILDEKLCNMFLKSSLPTARVQVMPKILCIGKIAHIDIKAFKVIKNGFIPAKSSSIHHKSELVPGKYY